MCIFTFSWKGVLWNHHYQSVNRSVSNDFFSKMAQKIFMKFGMKLWCLKGKKLTEPNFFILKKKKSYFGKKLKNITKIGWFGVYKKFDPLMCTIFDLTWSIVIVFIILQKSCLREICLNAKISSANQIAWCFKFEYLRNCFKYKEDLLIM